jgi:hypothetical protein
MVSLCCTTYDGVARILMVLLKQRRLLTVPLIMLMMTIAANDLQW